jgi:glycosyl transferase family 92
MTPDRPYLAACTIYFNHASYLREWVEFHRLVGVERFFLYDNGSTDDHETVLGPYVEEGIAVVHPWPGKGRQGAAYTDCLHRHRDDARWIAFMDDDEFVFNPRGRPVPEVLADYEAHPGIGVNSLSFGTSGHRRRPDGLLTENYLYRSGNPSNKAVNSIVDPQRTVRALGSHHFAYTDGDAVDVAGRPLDHGWRTKSILLSRLRINHYYTKSEEELAKKWSGLRADTGGPKGRIDIERVTRTHTRYLRDETILQYLPALKAACGAQPVA